MNRLIRFFKGFCARIVAPSGKGYSVAECMPLSHLDGCKDPCDCMEYRAREKWGWECNGSIGVECHDDYKEENGKVLKNTRTLTCGGLRKLKAEDLGSLNAH